MNHALTLRMAFLFAFLTSITLMFFAAEPPLRAQSSASAIITGRVVDSGGASIADATVTGTNTETGVSRSTTTTSDGFYKLENLNPGFYDLSVEATGFSKSI